jgi:hypothetical protein
VPPPNRSKLAVPVSHVGRVPVLERDSAVMAADLIAWSYYAGVGGTNRDGSDRAGGFGGCGGCASWLLPFWARAHGMVRGRTVSLAFLTKRGQLGLLPKNLGVTTHQSEL